MLSIRALSVLAALASTTSAHFTLNSLISAGFDDDAEATAQCGGFTVEFSNKSSISNFHTGGEVIATSLYHSQSDFLYRGTLDTTAAGGWIQLFPIVSQQGLGDMCEPAIPAPEAWVGKQGILGVAVNGPDGVLFQVSELLPARARSRLRLPVTDLRPRFPSAPPSPLCPGWRPWTHRRAKTHRA